MIDPQIIEKERKYLESLIKDEIIENKIIEYKQTLPGDTADDKVEFLADVSSFMNSSGGSLIYGMIQDQTSGKPVSLEGFLIRNADDEILRIENIIRDGLRPRAFLKTIIPVPLGGNRIALIIRMEKSWFGPHRVIFRGHDKFYARNTNGKYQMDVDELRAAFAFAASATDRIRDFHLDRIAKISAGETPVPIVDTAKLIFHLIPFSSFSSSQNYDLSFCYSHPDLLQPVRARAWHCQYNVDGLMSFYRTETENVFTYLQLYRNGVLEEVEGSILSPDERRLLIFPGTLEPEVIKALKRHLIIMNNMGVLPPLVYFTTLVKMKGYSMSGSPFEKFPGEIHSIDRDVLDLPDILIERFDIEPEKLLKFHFDLIWNACGFPGSPYYDGDGNRKKT